MALLSVNLDMAAALREMRHIGEPDPSQIAVLAEIAGVDGVVVSLHRDRRYIRERDVYLLKGIIKTKLTIEIPPVEDIVETILEIKPWMVTIVADQADSTTPMAPFDFNTVPVAMNDIVDRLKGAGINVSFYIDPEPEQVKSAGRAGANGVLLSCSRYTEARSLETAQEELDKLDRAASSAGKYSLAVGAGRGLNYKNVQPLVELGNVDEFFIGYSICSRAMMVGYDRAISEMKQLLKPTN